MFPFTTVVKCPQDKMLEEIRTNVHGYSVPLPIPAEPKLSAPWKLRVQDTAAQDTGTLNGWKLTF